MTQLSARDGAVLMEAIGICIDNGNPGLGSQISQWIAAKKAQGAPTHRDTGASLVDEVDALGSARHARRPPLRLVSSQG